MNENEYVRNVVNVARASGHKIDTNRSDLTQIDFGNKKLHEGHLRAMYPEILQQNANISNLIDQVAPGRPCTHRPMKEIMSLVVAAQP